MTKPNGRPKGRPPFVPDAQTTAMVEGMAAVGTPQAEMARVLGIAEKTLRRHFDDQIEVSRIKALARVKQSMFATATLWMREKPDGSIGGTPTRESVAAGIFLCKTVGKMSEAVDTQKHVVAHTGAVAVNADAAIVESARLLDQLARRVAGGLGPAGGLAAGSPPEADPA